MFERRRHQGSHAGYRIALWALVAVLGVLYYLNDSPVVLESDQRVEQEREDALIERDAESDVLVVIDYEAIEKSGESFEERDFSVAWINLFEQEIGPVSVATPGTLEEEQIDAARVVVLTSSVAGHVPEGLRGRFREHARDGNVLVIERPEGDLRQDFAADGKAGRRDAEQITYARGIEGRFKEQLLDMPLATHIVGSTGPRERSRTHLALDGAPAIYATPIGEGTVVVVDFDLGEQLAGLQQGRPTSSFEVDSGGRPTHTSDLIAEESLRTSTVPFADLFERYIVHGIIGYYTPLPTFWPFPGGAHGALVAIHEDKSLGDGGGWMLDYETERGAVSTLYSSIDADLSAASATVIHRQGGEIGLAWRMAGTPAEIRERVGLAGVEPAVEALDLGTQVEALEEATSRRVHTVRVADGYWDDKWARPFSLMAAHGIRRDTSYTPAPSAGFGFGTGFSFETVDERGLPTGVRELPVVYPTAVTEGPRLTDLVEASRKGHHQAIGWAIDPEIFADYPDMERFEQWLSTFGVAEQHDHVITSTARFEHFQAMRRDARLQSELSADVEVRERREGDDDEDSDKIKKKEATRLRIEVEARVRGMSITVPAEFDDKQLRAVQKGGRRHGADLVSQDVDSVPTDLVGYKLRRIPLETGHNRLNLYYR